MNNESEFIFDEVLESGFTVVLNSILTDDRLTDTAIGLYCRIIRCKNTPNFKIYQSTLINEKGHLYGVKYKVYSKAQYIENTNIKPKAEKSISDKQTLINKDNKK